MFCDSEILFALLQFTGKMADVASSQLLLHGDAASSERSNECDSKQKQADSDTITEPTAHACFFISESGETILQSDEPGCDLAIDTLSAVENEDGGGNCQDALLQSDCTAEETVVSHPTKDCGGAVYFFVIQFSIENGRWQAFQLFCLFFTRNAKPFCLCCLALLYLFLRTIPYTKCFYIV